MSIPSQTSRFARRVSLGITGTLVLLAGPAAAQGRLFQSPPEVTLQRGGSDARRLSAPGLQSGPTTVDEGARDVSLELVVSYLRGRIWDPATQRYQPVTLRGYADHIASPPDRESRVVGPTIRARPGDTVRMTLRNRLPPDPNCDNEQRHDVPGCFNHINMHSHGLWVSPTGNSDNVLLNLPPGSDFQYEYNISLDHPAGTFWYHPHRHGSTAMQVASAMSGAFIIEGDRKPGDRPEQTGDIDILTRRMPEKVLLFSQVPYGCFKDGQVQIISNPDDPNNGKFFCEQNQIGEVESFYQQLGFGNWSFQGWGASGRHTTVNGVVQPTFTMTAGQPERWRLIHAGTANQIGFSIRPLKGGASIPEGGVPAHQEAAFVEAFCGNPHAPLFGIQTDGLTRASVREAPVEWLQAGYRSDLLITLESGRYCLTDETPGDQTRVPVRVRESTRLLGVVEVSPSTTPLEATRRAAKEIVRSALIVQAGVVLRQEPAKTRVINELNEPEIRLTSFVPHRPISAAEVTGIQTLMFEITAITPPPAGAPPGLPTDRYMIDGKIYDPNLVNRVLPLGGVEEWTLTNNSDFDHTFHIHVNPFQVISATTENNQDAFRADELYRGLEGAWKDTIRVRKGYKIVVRTRYQRYIGEFVLHCHILDHEDQGMMQNISIVVPQPAAAQPRVNHRH